MPALKYWDVVSNSYVDLPAPQGPPGPPGASTAGVYVDVGAEPPDPNAPGITPPEGFLWIDTTTPPGGPSSGGDGPRGWLASLRGPASLMQLGQTATSILRIQPTLLANRRYRISVSGSGSIDKNNHTTSTSMQLFHSNATEAITPYLFEFNPGLTSQEVPSLFPSGALVYEISHTVDMVDTVAIYGSAYPGTLDVAANSCWILVEDIGSL
jgi:hypothetical protein